MNISKTGIRVVAPGQSATKKKRIPLDYALDMITYWRKESGQIVEITVPKFSQLNECLKSDGWRRRKCQN